MASQTNKKAESVGLPGFTWYAAPQRQATPGDGRIPKFRSGVMASHTMIGAISSRMIVVPEAFRARGSTSNKIK